MRHEPERRAAPRRREIYSARASESHVENTPPSQPEREAAEERRAERENEQRCARVAAEAQLPRAGEHRREHDAAERRSPAPRKRRVLEGMLRHRETRVAQHARAVRARRALGVATRGTR